MTPLCARCGIDHGSSPLPEPAFDARPRSPGRAWSGSLFGWVSYANTRCQQTVNPPRTCLRRVYREPHTKGKTDGGFKPSLTSSVHHHNDSMLAAGFLIPPNVL